MEENLFDKILEVRIEDEMKRSYIDYAMSVIKSRALPDVRDGLKPVHRRILYAMTELNLGSGRAYRKCARIVGDTMGKYHPHGDSAIYESLVRMAQDFSTRYLLVDGQGNYGSIDGDGAAAMRYTEARLHKIASELLKDINKNTVDFVPNFDESEKEPSVLPARFPNLLVNGSMGIAVGMATNIPPHNLTEVIDALLLMINNYREEDRETDIEEVLEIVTGPDFPTYGTILGKSGIREAYLTGRGKVKMRAAVDIVQISENRQRIVVKEIPYQVNKSRLIAKIADLVKDKTIEGISNLQDASDRNGIKINIELSRDANAEVILNQLYKYSQMQETFGVNMIALVDDEPRQLNLLQMLSYYLEHQKEVVLRKTQFEYDRAFKRAHIVEGLQIAQDNIDEVISIIRSAKDIKDAKTELQNRFELSEEQSQAIVEMKLGSLSGLERDKLLKELGELRALMAELMKILEDENKLFEVIYDDLTEIKEKYGDDRRTDIIFDPGDIDYEDLIEEEINVITMTQRGYIKRLPLDTYRSQNRGGRGIIGMQTRDEDLVKQIILSSTHNYLLFFTDKGKVYQIKAFEIPEVGRTARGIPIINILELAEGEEITAIIPVKDFEDGKYFFMATKNGIVKRTDIKEYSSIRRGGLIAIDLKDDDKLISVLSTSGDDHIVLISKNAMAIAIDEKSLRPLGRVTMGVIGIRLAKDDYLINSKIVDREEKLLIVSEGGYGKLLAMTEENLKNQNRGGKGVRIHHITEKTGKLAGVERVTNGEQAILASSDGVVIRIRIEDISSLGRVTQGVKLMNLANGIKVMSLAKVSEADMDFNERQNGENNLEESENLEENNLEESENSEDNMPEQSENFEQSDEENKENIENENKAENEDTENTEDID